MAAKRGNRTRNQRFEPVPLTDFTPGLCRHSFIGRTTHHRQRLSYSHLGKDVQKQRLFQLDRQPLLEHDIEDLFPGLVLEISQKNGVFLRQRWLAVEVEPPSSCNDRQSYERGENTNCPA